MRFNPNSIGRGGGGEFTQCDAKFSKKCSHNNNIALIKLIFLLDTALVKTNTKSFNSNFKKNTFDQ